MERQLTILGFGGSLRKGSYNLALLNASARLVPENTRLVIFGLGDIPLFNADLESSMPESAIHFKENIRAADAILIVTPEYNHSFPGYLKNAIDWASRPHGDNSFDGKPVAVMSVSTGMLGGARAQYHLRQTFVFLNMFPVNRPQVFVTHAAQKFDTAGNLTDETTEDLVRQLLEELVEWTRRLNP